MDQELIILLVMLGTFLLANFLLHLPVSLGMALGAIMGALVFGLFFGGDISELGRHLFEGPFAYLDTVLIIATAMVFMTAISKSGTMAALNNVIVTRFYKVPVIMLILLMIIVMFPGMITGSSTAGVLSAGAIVAPILMLMGVPKEKTGAVIAIGAILGMAAPPVNVPALLIAGGVDMPYSGFEAPLFFITLICGIIAVLMICLRYCRHIRIEDLSSGLDPEISRRHGFKIYLPIIVLAVLLIACRVFPNALPNIGMPLTFLIAAAVACFTGEKFNFINATKESLRTTVPVLGKLMGVGMFIQILTLTGARGWIVGSCIEMSAIEGIGMVLLFIAIAVACPAFGAVSSYGSASVLGVPFLLILIDHFPNGQVVMAAALSCIVCVGDLMPPTALAGNYAAALVEEKYSKVLRHCAVPALITIALSLIVIIFSETVFSFL